MSLYIEGGKERRRRAEERHPDSEFFNSARAFEMYREGLVFQGWNIAMVEPGPAFPIAFLFTIPRLWLFLTAFKRSQEKRRKTNSSAGKGEREKFGAALVGGWVRGRGEGKIGTQECTTAAPIPMGLLLKPWRRRRWRPIRDSSSIQCERLRGRRAAEAYLNKFYVDNCESTAFV